MPTPTINTKVDARQLPPQDRQRSVFDALARLGTGQTMELINDQVPSPLYRQLQVELPGDFGWVYLEHGPETWRVAITRLSSARCYGQGCTCCCNA